MSTEDHPSPAQVLTMQIISGALLVGVVIFLGMAVFIVAQNGPMNRQADVPLITYLAVGFFAIQLILWQVVPNVMVNAQLLRIASGTWTPPPNWPSHDPRYSTDEARLVGLYQTRLIIGAALLEGAAFFACIAFLLEGDYVSLFVAGVLILLMVGTFPTRQRVQSWLNHRLTEIQEMRQRGQASA